MKKKSLVAMGLAGVMTVGMCVPVLADDTNNEFTQLNSSNPQATTVSIRENVSYTVTIPKNITLEKGKESKIQVALTTAVMESDGKVKITVDNSKLTDGNLTLTAGNGTDKITSQLTIPNNTEINTVDSPIEYTLGNPSITYAGIYTGTIDFTVAYEATDSNLN